MMKIRQPPTISTAPTASGQPGGRLLPVTGRLPPDALGLGAMLGVMLGEGLGVMLGEGLGEGLGVGLPVGCAGTTSNVTPVPPVGGSVARITAGITVAPPRAGNAPEIVTTAIRARPTTTGRIILLWTIIGPPSKALTRLGFARGG
jgi:hypothetical protein